MEGTTDNWRKKMMKPMQPALQITLEEVEATLEPVAAPAGFGVAPVASDDALLWFNVIPNGRTVTLYRPTR